MIRGAHLLLYSKDPDADRTFFRDVLAFPYVDDGGGWLIFRLPPSEMAVHPSEAGFQQQHGAFLMCGSVLYLMCDDVRATLATLRSKNVRCSEPETEEWGVAATIELPGGGHIGIYQPTHKMAIPW